MRTLLRLPVVLIAIDARALAILLAIDLPAFLCRQRSAIGLAIRLHFMMNRGLLLLQVRGFTRRERTVLHALPNPLLLIALALVHLVVRQHHARTTQQQRTHHHACHNAFHVQFSFWTLKREPLPKV